MQLADAHCLCLLNALAQSQLHKDNYTKLLIQSKRLQAIKQVLQNSLLFFDLSPKNALNKLLHLSVFLNHN